ncbi:unnamed protein product [Caenorhabditis auriculariae]|uniref:BZIP domain-containing protein n=1 Tax=Caenorhabditis auriculariae TaxID=2777116 RepID=A0A8S1HJY3_9PELO|nr:unnamed protein product [Caenorhabditis auriculariae]
MDEEWSRNEVIDNDCIISSTADPEGMYSSNLFEDLIGIVKVEPTDDASDYNGSLSASPSSSLSSPTDMKEEPLGIDINFYSSFPSNNLSPASCSNSPFGFMPSGNAHRYSQEHSPLPPVTHFSQVHPQPPSGERSSLSQNDHSQYFLSGSNFLLRSTELYPDSGIADCSPSPPSSDRSSPMDGGLHSKIPNLLYDVVQQSTMSEYTGRMMNGLAAAQQQLKVRSKMHEMAVQQRLITDQDPRSQGSVQLSAEERRTLIQEGYPIPTRLPLSKNEEEALKIVRRKIKNKLSAQESRRKRKEYMDSLELRVQGYINENNHLKSRMRQLEQTNKQLMMKLRDYDEPHEINRQHN